MLIAEQTTIPVQRRGPCLGTASSHARADDGGCFADRTARPQRAQGASFSVERSANAHQHRWSGQGTLRAHCLGRNAQAVRTIGGGALNTVAAGGRCAYTALRDTVPAFPVNMDQAWTGVRDHDRLEEVHGNTTVREEVVRTEKYPSAPPLMLLNGSAGVAALPTFCAIEKK